MNHGMETRAADHHFQYKGWSVAVHLSGKTDEGIVTGHAALVLAGVPKCRISLAAPHRDGAGAISALARMARAFIDDWQEREHTGETGFTAL